MAMTARDVGLDHAIAAETRLSGGDPVTGENLVRGYPITTLLERDFRYEDALALLWEDVFPGIANPKTLGDARVRAYGHFLPILAPLPSAPPVETQRSLLSTLPEDPDDPLLTVAGAGVAMTMALRKSENLPPLPAPDPGLGHAADLLRMAHGTTQPQTSADALDVYMVAMIDHGVNPSTLAARLAASTGAGRVAAAVAALCTLQGPRHGGAPGMVIDMLDAIAASGDIQAWVDGALKRGERLMGFGSRAYPGRDPRRISSRLLSTGCPTGIPNAWRWPTARRRSSSRPWRGSALAKDAWRQTLSFTPPC
jgi:citrate synthase